jgi:hypothetical protein
MFEVREGNDGYYLRVKHFKFEYWPFIWVQLQKKAYGDSEKIENYSNFENEDLAVWLSEKDKAFIISGEKWVIRIL